MEEDYASNLLHIEPPKPEASVVDRLKYLIKLSRHTQAEFAKLIDIDPASVSRVLSGRLKPSESFLNRVVVNLHVSKDWLKFGTDVPFPRTEVHAPARFDGAPVYNIDVTAGTNTPLSRMFTTEHVVGYMKLPGLNPDYPIVRVSGNSMVPKINPGSYISIRQMPLDAPVAWGSIYVVVLPDFRMVKYVRRKLDDPSKVVLHSANPEFDDIEVDRSDIEALYLVENIINHDLVA